MMYFLIVADNTSWIIVRILVSKSNAAVMGLLDVEGPLTAELYSCDIINYVLNNYITKENKDYIHFLIPTNRWWILRYFIFQDIIVQIIKRTKIGMLLKLSNIQIWAYLKIK